MINLNQIDYSNIMELIASPEWVAARRSGEISSSDMAKVLNEANKRNAGQLPNSTSSAMEAELKRLKSMQESQDKAKAEMATLSQLMGDKEDPYVKQKSQFIARQEVAVEQQVNNLISRLAALREAQKRTKDIQPQYKPKEPDAMPYHMAANDKNISFVVNEFAARYFTDSAGKFDGKGQGTPEEYWKHFVKNSFISKRDGFSPNIEADAIKAVKAAQARLSNNVDALRYYSHFKYDSQVATNNTLKIALNTLYSSDKSHAVIFAPDKKESTLATSAAKMMYLQPGLNKVEMLTPNGSKIFTRKDVYHSMPKKSEKDIATSVSKSVLSFIGSGKESNYYTPLAKQQALYSILQDNAERQAKDQLVSLAVLANGQAGKSGLKNTLGMNVSKLKAYGDYFGSTFKDLGRFTRDDRKTLGESLDASQLERLQQAVEDKFDSSRKVYQASAFSKALNLGKELGIKPDAIEAQLAGKNSFERAKALQGINAFLSDSMEDVKAHNKLNKTDLTSAAIWGSKFPKRNSFSALLNSPLPSRNSAAVKALIQNLNNEKFLQSRGLLDGSVANPILNLKGHTQERFLRLFAKGIAETNVPFSTTFKGSVKVASKFMDTLSAHKLGHMEEIFSSVSEKMSEQDDNRALSPTQGKLAKGAKFAKYPSQLRDPKLKDFIDMVNSHKSFKDEFENMKQYEASNFMASVSDPDDELRLTKDGKVSNLTTSGYMSRKDRDDAKLIVEGRLKAEAGGKPIDEIASAFDIDSLVEKELQAQGKSNFSIKSSESIKQAIFGKDLTVDDSLSHYEELRLKAQAGSLTFDEHEKLMSLAQAVGVYTSNKAGTAPNVAKIINRMNGLQTDYLTKQKTTDESRQAGVHLNTYLRWAASQGYISQWSDGSTKKALEAQYKQFVDLGLIRIVEDQNGKPMADFSRLTHSTKERNSGIFIGTKDAMDDVRKTVMDFLDPSGDTTSIDDIKRTALLKDLEGTKYPSNYVYQAAKAIKAGKADKTTIIDNLFSNLRLGSDMVEKGSLRGSGYAKLPEIVKIGPVTAKRSNDLAKTIAYYKNPEARKLADDYVGQLPIHGKDDYKDPLAIQLHTILKAIGSEELSLKGLDQYGHSLSYKSALVGTELLKGHLTSGKDGFNTAKSKAYHNAMQVYVDDIRALQGPSLESKLRVLKKYNKLSGQELARDMYTEGLQKVLVGGISSEDIFHSGSKVPKNVLAEIKLSAKSLAEQDFGSPESLSGLNTSLIGTKKVPLSYTQRLDNYFAGIDTSKYTPSLSGRAFDAENLYLEGVEKNAISNKKAATSKRLSAIRRLFPLHLALGGKIPGKGTKDEVPALLMKGEMVVDRATTERLGIHTQEDYNRFKQAVSIAKLANGGPVDETEEQKQKREALEKLAKDSLGDIGSLMDIPEVPTSQATPEASKPAPNVKPKVQTAKEPSLADIIAGLSVTDTKESVDLKAKMAELRGMSISQIQEFVASGEYGKYQTGMGGNPLKPFFNLATSENVRSLDKDMPISSYYALDDTTVMHPDEAKLLKATTKGLFNQAGVAAAIDDRTQSKYADMISQLASNSVEELSTMLKDPNQQARIFGVLDKAKNKILTPKAQQEYAKLQGTVIESVVGMSSDDFKTMISKPGTELGSFSPAVQGNLQALAGNDNDYSRFKAVLGNDGKALDGIMRPAEMTNLSKALNTINSNLDSFNKLFGTNINKISDQAGLDKAVQELLASNKDGYAVNKRTSTSEELGAARRMVGDLNKATDSTTKEGFETSNKLNEMNRQMGDSQSIRERSQMRWANFKDLTVQNAAFAASYGVIGAPIAAASAGAGFLLELDDKLKNLQAITASTTPELERLTKSVKQVSVETKFSAGEIADAATILGQAGFSAQDIQDSLKGVAELATATGSNLEDATQTLTSALTVWDAPMRDSTKYANEFTAAINKSKLDMNSLSLALQYAGNIAAEGGIPVEDVLTITSLMKDAGIRQGSTVGTGQRLVYSDIISPSAKFTESLAGVGISKGQLKGTFEEEGILGALKLMKDSGYGFTQAASGMELREKSAYMAMINQLDKAQLFKSGIIGTDAASQANDIQMQSILNLGKNMLNSWGVLLSDTLGTEFKGLSKALSALTYNGKNDTDGDGVEDKSPEIGGNIDYYSKVNGLVEGLSGKDLVAGVLTAGGVGYGITKALGARMPLQAAYGAVASAPGLASKAGVGYGIAKDGFKAAGSGLKNAGSIKGGMYVGAFLEALNVVTSDNPEAEAVKAIPRLAALYVGMKGGAMAGGAVAGPYGALGGAVLGGIGSQVAYSNYGGKQFDSRVDRAFGIQKNYFDATKSFNTSLESGSSAMRDMYTTRLDVQRTRNNPLAVTEGMTATEVAQVKASLNKYSEELNKTYKAQIDELKTSKVKDSTGKDFDFTYNAGSNVQLASYMKEFEDAYGKEQQKAVVKMNDAAIKTLNSEKDFKLEKENFKDQTAAVREDLDGIIATQARIDPKALSAMMKTHTKAFDKYIAKALDARIAKLDEDLDDNVITESQYTSKVKEARDTAKREKETFTANSSSAMLTAGLNLRKPEDIKAWAADLDKLVGKGTIDRESVTQQQLSLMQSYNQSVINENPIMSKVMEDLSEFNSKFQEVNKVFKEFFKGARDAIGDQSVAIGRSSGSVMLGAASSLGTSWEGLNDIKSRAGKAGIRGLNESWMKDSPDDPAATQYFKSMYEGAKITPVAGLAQGAREAASIEFKNIMAASKIAETLGTLPLTLNGLVNKFGEDPQMLKAFYARQDKLEEIGLNRNTDLTALAALSTKEIATGDIDKLKKNINPVMQKTLEFQKLMAVERLEVQKAELIEANFGGKNVPYEQSEFAYANKQREKQYQQNIEAQGRQVEFQKANLVLNYQRNLEDLEAKSAFQRNELAIGYGNQVAGMARQYSFNQAMTVLQSGWQRADLMEAQENNLEDAARKKRYATEDLTTNTRYKTEDANKNLERSLTQLALNFSRSVESIQRAMAFTETMFERNMDKPVNINLNPEAFMKVAVALNDTTLALDAHKAELANNTGAIQQLIGIQQSKEDLAKEAYKAAYKAVGGEVYKEDGTVNEAFTTEYNQYMKNNSEQLLDTVLEQAINRSMAGTGFDVTSALTDASYMANAVVNPGDATTTESMVAGSGYTPEDIINALLGTASGEVRLTTTQGVVLEAQGDLGAALFDLQTSMLQYQNQISEASIQYTQAITDAQQNLAYTLEDIGTAFGRGLESIQTAYMRDIEQAGENFTRQMDQISTNLDRSLSIQTMQYQFQLQEAAIRFRESLEALSRQEAFNKEQLAIGLQRALEDLASSAEFRLKETAINNEQNEIAISEGFARLMEKANIANEAAVRAIEFQMSEAIRKATFDAVVLLDVINRGLRQSLQNQLPDMAFMITSFSKAIEKSAAETEWKLSGVLNAIATGLEKASKDEQIQKQFRDVGSKSLNEILTGVTSGMPTTVKTVIDAINEPINTKFKEGLSSVSREMVNAAEKSSQEMATASTKLQEPTSRLSSVFMSLTDQSRIMLTQQSDLTRQVASVGTVSSQAMATAAAQIAAIKNQIAASAASGTVYRSSGGIIPGYGGGDIVPAMLEPGEYVIRKEAVKAIGEEALNKLNSGNSTEFIKANLSSGSLEGARVTQNNITNTGTNLSVGINIHPEMTIKSIQDNIEKIADGVHRVFQEYM